MQTIRNKISNIKERISEALDDIYRPDDLILMDDGMGTVEVILIIVVLVGLVLIFKKQIKAIVNSIMNKISSDANDVMS
jgi:hypothetical protein